MKEYSVDDESRAADRKDNSKKLHFEYTFRPIYYISRVFGQMPFSFVRDSNGEIQVSKVGILDGIWCIVSILMYSGMAYSVYCSIEIPQDPSVNSSTLLKGDNLSILIEFILCLFMIGVDMFNRSKLVNILKDFTIFDEQVIFNKPQLLFVLY